MSWMLSLNTFILLIVIVSSAKNKKKGRCGGAKGDVPECNQLCAELYDSITYDDGAEVPVCKGWCKFNICRCRLNPDLRIPKAPTGLARWSFNSKVTFRGKYYEALYYRETFGTEESKERAKEGYEKLKSKMC